MGSRITRIFAWSTLALSVALFGAQLALIGLTPAGVWSRRAFFFPIDPTNLCILTYSVVGAVIILRRPQNAVGWLFAAVGLTWEMFGATQDYATYLYLNLPSAFQANNIWLVLGLNLWVVSFGAAPLLLFLFPHGYVNLRRWAWLAVPYGFAVVVTYLTAQSGFWAGSTDLNFPSPLLVSGMVAPNSQFDQLDVLNGMISMLAFVVGAVSLVLRLRRSRGDERLQLKWFVYASFVLVAVNVATGMFFDWFHQFDPQALYQADLFYGIPFALPFAGISVAVGIAILRYRLYEIDVIIRRTLVYSVLTATLLLFYWGCVLLLQEIFRGFTGQGSDLAIILSTLAIAALFNPLRHRVQFVIDQRFYRRKYDSQKVLAQFGATARDEVDLNRLTDELLQVTEETMQPASLSLSLKSTAPSKRSITAAGEVYR